MNKTKKIIIIVAIVITILALLGGTYAYWKWQLAAANRTTITLTYADGFSCTADGGGDITSSNVELVPATCINSNYAIKRTVTVTPTLSNVNKLALNLWINVVSMDENLRNSDYFSYALTKSSSSCTTDVIATGTFKGKANGSTVPLLDNKIYESSTPDVYYLYIWLDKDETNNNTMNQNFHFTLGGNCTNEVTNGTDIGNDSSINPILDTGMIPVTIANNGTVTTVSVNDPSWYDYDNKQWANAVLVKETADTLTGSHDRSYYKTNSENGNNVTVTESDILAYYVWIPRYSYKIWTLGESATGGEQEIDIKFVNKNTKDNGTQVDEYYTHPAFTFGDKELDGIWVGKFEMSHNTLSSSTTSNNLGCTSTTCTNASGLRILPNVTSLRYNNISNMWYSLRSMEQSNNVFGISNSDSHMMKNREWGAAAYLSHSKYGINTEIRINNNGAYTTGCGAATANASQSANCDNRYGTVTSYPQSTTGNISGIFDMSGGAMEYVMGNHGNTTSDSGFAADWFTSNSKYYDLYDSSIFTGNYLTNYSFCSLSTCGGHALNETKKWYSDNAFFVISSGPWFFRGGPSSKGTRAGAFYSKHFDGYSSNDGSFRGVLAAR